MAVKSSIYFLCRNLNAPAVVPSPAAPTPAMAAVAQACGGSFGGSGADSAPVIRRVWWRQQLPVKVREMKGKVRHKGIQQLGAWAGEVVGEVGCAVVPSWWVCVVLSHPSVCSKMCVRYLLGDSEVIDSVWSWSDRMTCVLGYYIFCAGKARQPAKKLEKGLWHIFQKYINLSLSAAYIGARA